MQPEALGETEPGIEKAETHVTAQPLSSKVIAAIATQTLRKAANLIEWAMLRSPVGDNGQAIDMLSPVEYTPAQTTALRG